MHLIKRLSNEGLAIFLFHGVVNSQPYHVRNYTKKHLSEGFFDELMRNLKREGTPLSMDEIIWHCQNKVAFPPKAFAVTFDDGFENNYSLAIPILKKHKIPAIFYITTEFIDKNAMSWIDRIEYCLELSVSGKFVLPWTKEPCSFKNSADKIRILDHIRSHVKEIRGINLDNLVDDIFSQCGVPLVTQSMDPLDLKMNWQEVKELVKDDLFTIGGHSHRHVILTFLTPHELRSEIQTSLSLIKNRAGIETKYYSYPEGMSHCYSEDVISALRNEGIICSLTAEDGLNDLSGDLFRLKRINVIE